MGQTPSVMQPGKCVIDSSTSMTDEECAEASNDLGTMMPVTGFDKSTKFNGIMQYI